jgi:multiple sugar transport system permease protein
MFSYPPAWIPTDPTLDNYVGFFKSGKPIYRWVFNSFFITATVTTIQLFFSSLIAYTFAKRKFPGRDFLFFMGLAVLMLPSEVLLIPQYLIMKSIPLFGGNNIQGIGGHGWLDSYWALIVPNIASPFSIFLLRQYMRSIPDELIDAARIDGAGHFRIYWKIILPLSRPALAAVAIFTFVFSWNHLLWPLLVLTNPDLMTIPVGLATVQGSFGIRYADTMASAILGALPLVAVFLLFQRNIVEGIAGTGLKG